jgi:glyoxylate reductase
MKVLVTGRIPDEVRAQLAAAHQVQINPLDRPMARADILGRLADTEGLLCMITDVIDAELLDHAPRLKAIANHGVGYDNIDVAAATARGIPVSNTPGVLTDATADITVGLILAVARRMVEGDRRNREGRFRHWAPLLFLGTEVTAKTLGIVGLGRIGRAVVKRCRGFEMKVIYHSRTRLGAREEAALGVSHRSLEALLAEADFVSLHLPLTPATRHLIGAAELRRMKACAFLINTSRGPVVDEAALVAALKAGVIRGAGLDVYENEPRMAPGLAELDNAVLLPHVGSATWETRTRMARLAADNLLAALAGAAPPNCVNPEVLPVG